MALGNVFQFICGLSEDGALAILRHLKSVRMADPLLDLSKTVPDAENETDRSLNNVTQRQGEFRDLVVLVDVGFSQYFLFVMGGFSFTLHT